MYYSKFYTASYNLLKAKGHALIFGGTGTETKAPIVTAATFRLQDLPVELLIGILLSALPTNWSAGDLQLLASVCRYWRDIILSTPRFWRVVDSRHGRHSWSQVLKRNKAGSLDVLMRGVNVSWNDLGRIPQFIEFITPESRRIRSVYFDTFSFSPHFKKFFDNVSLPCMDGLTGIMARPGGLLSVPMSIELGDGIPLRYLHLASVSIPWDTPRLSGLKALTLRNLDDNFPTSTQLYHILVSAHFLEHFSFINWKPGSNAEFPDPQEIAPVKLRLLKSVGIDRIPQSINARLLSMLDNPVLEDVVWTDLRGLESGYTLLRWSSTGIKISPELVVRWYSWAQTLDIKSREWKKASTPQESHRPVDLSIKEIQNPSELIEELAKLLSKSNSVVLETDSTEVATLARTAFERSGADFSIPILAP